MHDERELIEARIRRTVRERIRPAIHGERVPLDVGAWHLSGEPVSIAAARAADYTPFSVGGRWGTPWGTTWFRMQGTVPARWRDRTVEVRVDINTGVGAGFQSEGLVYRTTGGGPIRGVHPFHQAIPLDLVSDDGRVDILVEAAANPIIVVDQRPTPLGHPATAGDALLYRLNAAELAVRNTETWHLDLDLQIVTGLVRELSLDDPRRHELLHTVDAALDRLDLHDVASTAYDARAVLAPVLARPASEHAHRMSAVGHAHIDTAWLWPLRETRRKCARTFSSAVTLMEQYPEYRFVASQAAQYEWIEHDHPDLFERIRDKVADGRFVPVGSMWVEADTNLPSGESLARQFVWGKRYFADRFGVDTREVWIPDVFGYSAALPQIMAQAGCEHFLTQKLSWNQTNPFPHHTFWWEGLDGTRVFTHFPPADTYNGEVRPDELAYAVRNFRDKGGATRSMYLFGHGDGGGGPTREMLELARRVHNEGRGLDGLPHLDIEPPAAFFDHAVADYPDAPVWRGELYFEMHRGTYTSQARTKWGNRRAELALRELELWTALDESPPLGDLERWWKRLLLHQFHDIIPGSGIAWVHEETETAHANIRFEVEERIRSVLWARGEDVAANAAPFAFDGVVGEDPVWASAPAHGVGTVSAELPEGVDPVDLDWTDSGAHTLDNGLVRATVGADGTLVSFLDRRLPSPQGRECLAGPGNVLQLFPDHPNTYDAWDVEAHTLRLRPELLTDVESTEIVTQGPMRCRVRVSRRFGERSAITQTYVLRAGSARLDIVTEVDWYENEKLLKAAFPFDVRADEASFDIQYGHVRRPTHRNTTWDAARFEVCGHFWADVSEPDFGVAVLNNGRYGHDCVGDARATTMRLSLLRAPNYPDPDADRGRHRFTYSLLSHGPGLADVLAESWALNLPPRVTAGQVRPPVVSVDHPGVVVTAVKAADDGSGDLIVRVHEAFGGRARDSLAVTGGFEAAVRCDLLERPVADPEPVADGALGFELRPFELRTLRFTR